MALFDFIGGLVETVGLTDIVGGFIDNLSSTFNFNLGGLTDVFSGAITNAAVTAIAGGDIGKAALFGAVGGGLKGFGNMGTLGDTLSAATSGYGLAEANGANGLLGAASSAVGSMINDKMKAGSGTPSTNGGTASTTGVSSGNNPASGVPATPSIAGGQATAAAATSTGLGSITDKLKDLGLVDATGKQTLLGQALLAGAGAVGTKMLNDELLKKQQEQAIEREQARSDIEAKAEQDRLRFFTDKTNPYKIQRSQ